MNQIEQTLLLNNQIREQVETLRERNVYSANEKNDLLLAYFDIILEHHDAIGVLIKNELVGSGFALVRPVAETFYRALWVNASATPQQINQILNDDSFGFPNDMMKQIDAAYSVNGGSPTQDFFQSLKRASWESMCSYTHSGLRQINRRFHSDGGVGANYSEGEILEVLNATTALLLFVGVVFFKSVGCDKEASEMENLIMSSSTRPK